MCQRIKRAKATFIYLIFTFASVVLAGLLKYAVAPALVQFQTSSFVTNSTRFIDGAQVAKDLFYAISDCATRVDAWNLNNTLSLVGNTTLTEQDLVVKCIGNYFVFRVSFTLSVVFLIFAIITKCSPLFHNGDWATKIFLYCFFMVGSFFVPNGFFYGYSYVAKIGSFLFILLQLIIIVDYAFDWHEDFLLKMEQCSTGEGDGGEDGTQVRACGCCTCGLGGVQALFLTVSFLHLLVAIVGTILLYVFYTTNRPGCDENMVIVTITLLLGLFITVTGVIPCKSNAGGDNGGGTSDDGSIGLLVPSLVFCYCVYYAYDSVKANPNPMCHPDGFLRPSENGGAIVLGLLVSGFSIVWISLRTAQRARGVIQTTRRDSVDANAEKDRKKKQRQEKKRKKRDKQKKHTNQIERGDDDGDVSAVEEGGGPSTSSTGIGVMEIDNSATMENTRENDEDEDDEDVQDTLNKQIWLFHFILAMGALYMGMILTQWGGYTGASSEENEANQATALWVNAIGGWVAYAIFGWIRMAPLCCPGRDFRDAQDGF
jgi:hypothetical protein